MSLEPLIRPSRDLPRDNRHFVWSLPVSGLLHATIFATFGLMLVLRSCVVFTDSGEDGENGVSGSGGREVEFSLEGPPADTLGHATPPPAPPQPPTPPPPETPPTTQAHRDTPPHPHPVTHDPPDEHDGELVAASPPAPPPAPHPDPPSRLPPGGGTGNHTDSGMRPGSIGSQRALLPHAVACNDPVAGTWRAQKYDPLYGDWMLATLRIHRASDNTLAGTIVSHQWDGGPHDAHPPPCGPFGLDFIVDMPGSGAVRGDVVDFGASTWHLREFRCNPLFRVITYNPDHFSGRIDGRIQEFQSVNNDGGRAVNDPMVFRRIACLPGDERVPTLEAEPDVE